MASLAQLRARYRAAVLAESRGVAKLPENASRKQIDAAWRRAERTNEALRALQAHPDYDR